jgi:hypothetical protein
LPPDGGLGGPGSVVKGGVVFGLGSVVKGSGVFGLGSVVTGAVVSVFVGQPGGWRSMKKSHLNQDESLMATAGMPATLWDARSNPDF